MQISVCVQHVSNRNKGVTLEFWRELSLDEDQQGAGLHHPALWPWYPETTRHSARHTWSRAAAHTQWPGHIHKHSHYWTANVYNGHWLLNSVTRAQKFHWYICFTDFIHDYNLTDNKEKNINMTFCYLYIKIHFPAKKLHKWNAYMHFMHFIVKNEYSMQFNNCT